MKRDLRTLLTPPRAMLVFLVISVMTPSAFAADAIELVLRDLNATKSVVGSKEIKSYPVVFEAYLELATPPMEFFVTFDEQGIYDANEKILNEPVYGDVSQLVNTTIGIVANNDNTIIYYDHHEDGYEADLESR